MGVHSFEELKEHVGHKLECVTYGDENVAVECTDCNTVLLDFDRPKVKCVGCGSEITPNETEKDIGYGVCVDCRRSVEPGAENSEGFDGWKPKGD